MLLNLDTKRLQKTHIILGIYFLIECSQYGPLNIRQRVPGDIILLVNVLCKSVYVHLYVSSKCTDYSIYTIHNRYYYIVINIFLLILMENDRAIYPCICTLSIKCILHQFKYEYLKQFNIPLKYNKIHNICIKNALGIKYSLLYNKRVIA